MNRRILLFLVMIGGLILLLGASGCSLGVKEGLAEEERAEELLQSGDYLAAREAFSRLEKEGGALRRLSYLGQAKSLVLMKNDPHTALWYIHKAYGEPPYSSSEIHLWKAFAHKQMGDYLMAEPEGRAALDMDAERPVPHRFLAELYREWGNTAYSLDEYNQTLRYGRKDDPEVLFLSAWMMLRLKNREGGIERLRWASSEMNDSRPAKILLLLYSEERGLLEEIRDADDTALKFTAALGQKNLSKSERQELFEEARTRKEGTISLWAQAALKAMEK